MTSNLTQIYAPTLGSYFVPVPYGEKNLKRWHYTERYTPFEAT